MRPSLLVWRPSARARAVKVASASRFHNLKLHARRAGGNLHSSQLDRVAWLAGIDEDSDPRDHWSDLPEKLQTLRRLQRSTVQNAGPIGEPGPSSRALGRSVRFAGAWVTQTEDIQQAFAPGGPSGEAHPAGGFDDNVLHHGLVQVMAAALARGRVEVEPGGREEPLPGPPSKNLLL